MLYYTGLRNSAIKYLNREVFDALGFFPYTYLFVFILKFKYSLFHSLPALYGELIDH